MGPFGVAYIFSPTRSQPHVCSRQYFSNLVVLVGGNFSLCNIERSNQLRNPSLRQKEIPCRPTSRQILSSCPSPKVAASSPTMDPITGPKNPLANFFMDSKATLATATQTVSCMAQSG